jgi:uncharacterized protein YycO
MKVRAFVNTCTNLARAENECILHLAELVFQTHPSWEDIDKGFRLTNELKELHLEAMEEFARCAGLVPTRAVSNLLKHSTTTLTEALFILDGLARSFHSRS